MTKFKVGDLVRVKGPDYLRGGGIGLVIKLVERPAHFRRHGSDFDGYARVLYTNGDSVRRRWRDLEKAQDD